MYSGSRRHFLEILTAALAGRRAAFSEELPPVRALTHGPKFHWFGYYDKLEFDPAGRYVLGMEVDFEHRSPRPDDVIRIGMVDLEDGERWTELGTSCAWNWQQGCMLQWLPGSGSEVIWNDRQQGRFVSHILNLRSGRKRTLPAPIYALSPDGAWAVSPDFHRLNDTRPGYGYAGIPDPNHDTLVPRNTGIWRMELAAGKRRLLISLAAAARIPYEHGDWTGAKHWFNHLLVSPNGERFIYLHRWRAPGDRTFSTRMFTAAADGAEPFILDPFGKTSHFIWRDPKTVLAWTWRPSHGNRFYLCYDQTDRAEVIGPDVMRVNGHCSYLPGNRWILNDTYPDKKQRLQNPYLYEATTGRRVWLGHFHSPPEYKGEWRCDLHPRFSPDGRKVVIDSPHGGNGRQMYLIDISGIVGRG